MSMKEKRTSFIPAGAACWPLSELPDWRGGLRGWWDENAVWDFDAYQNRAMAAGGETTLAALVSTTRASSHILRNASGSYQSFGNDTLARIDGIGAYIGGQVTNLWGNPGDMTAANWLRSGASAPTAAGDFWTVVDASAGAASQIYQSPTGILTANTAMHTVWVDVKKDSENSVIRCVALNLYPNAYSFQLLLNTSTGAYRNAANPSGYPATVRDLGDRWRVVWTFPNNNDTDAKISFAPAWNTNINAGVDVTAQGSASFCWPHFITGNYPGDSVRVSGTRLASNVTAASMGWFAPLASGATELVIPKWSHVGDGINRPLFEYVADANNYIRGYINASDKPALKIVAGGATQTDTAMTTSIATGRKPLVFGWSASGGYVGNAAGQVATFGAVTLPGGIVSKRIGSSQAGNYLNDLLERMTAYRLRTQSQALALVAAA